MQSLFIKKRFPFTQQQTCEGTQRGNQRIPGTQKDGTSERIGGKKVTRILLILEIETPKVLYFHNLGSTT